MAKATFVKSARKNYPEHGINKGEPYYWWKFRFGGKHYSKTPPKPSQLTQSEFWSQVFEFQERELEISIPDDGSLDTLKENADAVVEEIRQDIESLRDEQQEKFDALPENFQDADTGQRIQGRIDALDEAISELENIDTDFEEGEDDEEPDDKKSRIEDRITEIVGEIQTAVENISCE